MVDGKHKKPVPKKTGFFIAAQFILVYNPWKGSLLYAACLLYEAAVRFKTQ